MRVVFTMIARIFRGNNNPPQQWKRFFIFTESGDMQEAALAGHLTGDSSR